MSVSQVCKNKKLCSHWQVFLTLVVPGIVDVRENINL